MAKKKPKAKASLWDKVHDIDPNFAVQVNTATDDFLKEALVTLDNHDEQIFEARENDPDLPVLREQLKTANETYNVPLKHNKLKRKLAIDILKGRGKLS